MMDASDHAKVVLAAIIPNRRDLLDKALQHLAPGHFPDAPLRNMFQLLERYAEVTGSIMTRAALSDMLRNQADPGKVALYEETYDALHDRVVDDGDFRWSLQQVRELAAERSTSEALTQGMEILRSGATTDRGQTLKGHHDARMHVLERFSDIDRELSMQTSPEGDMRTEGQEMLEDYAERKQLHTTGASRGVLFGVPDLDYKIGGLQPGELDLIVGYSSDGKTSLCVQAAWSAAVEQGINTVILTTETLRPQVRRKLLSRHSKHEMFELPEGINSRDLKNGTLTEDQERRLTQDIIPDFTKNPNYGRLYIAQVPRGATIATCEARLYRIQRQFNIEFCIIDYLRLLRSERKRSSDREELGAIIIEGKQLATTFDDGRGIPILSPWQVNRTARDNAERLGYYTTVALAETAEATNTSDVIVSLLAPSENEDRYCEVKGQVMKNRDGETANSIPIQVDYATSTFTSKRQSSGLDDLLDSAPRSGGIVADTGSEFASLLG